MLVFGNATWCGQTRGCSLVPLLDTQGFSNGNLTYRNLMSQNVARFRTHLVRRSEVLAALPPGTAMVSSGERMKQMADRYHSIKLRYGI